MQPDPVTFVGLLKACGSVLVLEEGRLAHELIMHWVGLRYLCG